MYSSTSNTLYQVVVYDLPLYQQGGIYFPVNPRIVAYLYQVTKDNCYLGITTAYCQGYQGPCPQFVDDGLAGYGGTW